MAETTPAGQKPNVILAGQKKPVTVPVEGVHEGEVTIGMTTIKLPDEETQRAGWYEEKASMLIQQYPGIYKTPQALAAPQAQSGEQGERRDEEEGQGGDD